MSGFDVRNTIHEKEQKRTKRNYLVVLVEGSGVA